MFLEKKKKKMAIVLIDYDNIVTRTTELGKIVDFQKLHEYLLKFGEIIFAKVFIPIREGRINVPDDLNNFGYEIVACQLMKESYLIENEKLEDMVDINIILAGMEYCNFSDITDIVVVAHDKHMVNLIKKAKNRKKKVHIVGLDQVSRVLKRVVDIENIYSTLPVKS